MVFRSVSVMESIDESIHRLPWQGRGKTFPVVLFFVPPSFFRVPHVLLAHAERVREFMPDRFRDFFANPFRIVPIHPFERFLKNSDGVWQTIGQILPAGARNAFVQTEEKIIAAQTSRATLGRARAI